MLPSHLALACCPGGHWYITALYFCVLWMLEMCDQCRGPRLKEKDHLVGQQTTRTIDTIISCPQQMLKRNAISGETAKLGSWSWALISIFWFPFLWVNCKVIYKWSAMPLTDGLSVKVSCCWDNRLYFGYISNFKGLQLRKVRWDLINCSSKLIGVNQLAHLGGH